jgi:hypothetical protein
MKITTQIYAVMLVAAAAFAQGPAMGHRGIQFAGPASRTPVTGAPYSAVETRVFQQPLAGGNVISKQEVSKVYRDRDGRVRIEHTRTPPGGGAAETRVTIFDPVGGVSYLLDPAAKSVVKHQLPASSATASARTHTAHAQASKPNVATEDLGKQAINGVPASGTRITETIPAGAIGNAQPISVVRETWISTDLKVPVQIKTVDPRFGNSTMQLSNISQSEPDAALFQAPADYAVKSWGEWRMGSTRGMRHGPAQQ